MNRRRPDDSIPYLQSFYNTELSAIWIIFKRHFVSHQHFDAVNTHLAGEIRQNTFATFDAHTKHGVRECFRDGSCD